MAPAAASSRSPRTACGRARMPPSRPWPALFGIGALACFGLAERLPFNPLELVWDPRQLLYLLAPVRPARGAVLLRRRLHRPRSDLLPGPGRPDLPRRPARRGLGRARDPGALVPGAAGAGARAGRSARPARGGPGPLGRPGPARLAARGGARRAGAAARGRAGPLEHAPALALQEPEPGADGSRRHRRG